jgi:hypothetical protein
MQFSREAPAIKIVLQVISLARTLTEIADVAVGLNAANHAQPPLAGRAAVGLLVEPAGFHSGDLAPETTTDSSVRSFPGCVSWIFLPASQTIRILAL